MKPYTDLTREQADALAVFLAHRMNEDIAISVMLVSEGADLNWETRADGVYANRGLIVHRLLMLDEANGVPGSKAVLTHVAHWDPCKAMAQVEVVTRIVGSYMGHSQALDALPTNTPDLERQVAQIMWEITTDSMRMVAMGYRHHPDFQHEWTYPGPALTVDEIRKQVHRG